MEKGPGKQTACGELKKKGAQFIFRRKQFHAPRGHDASTDRCCYPWQRREGRAK